MTGSHHGDRQPSQARNVARERAPRRREVGAGAEAATEGTYIVGRRAALEILKNDVERKRIEKVYLAHGVQGPQIAEIVHQARKLKLAVGELDRNKFRDLEKRISGGAETQGVILLVSEREYQELEDVLGSPTATMPPLLVALDGVEDPHNIGAIIRSSEAAGANGVLIARRGAVLTPAVYKTSAGAATHFPIVRYGNLDQTIRSLQEEHMVTCLGLAGEAEKTIYETDMTGPICLITGSEEKGLHRLVRERCDQLIKIPMNGQTASLNASVATAVALFEAMRQRSAS